MNVVRQLALIAVAILVFSSAAQAADTIRIAYQPSPLYAPLFVAKANNWVDEELAKSAPSAKAIWTVFADGPAMNESFAADQQDIGFMGDTPALIGKSVGIDTKVVGLSVSGPKGLALIVESDSPYATPQDLKGKKVAVTKGSWAQHFLALVFEKANMTFKDVELLNMPPAEIPAALFSGSIAAGATWEPYITRFESKKTIRVLVDGTGFKKGVQPIVATKEAVRDRRKAVEAVLRAYARGAEFIRQNPAAAASLVAAEFNLSPDMLEKIFAKQTFAPPLLADDIAEFKSAEAYMRKLKLIKTAVDVDAWIDRSFLPAQTELPSKADK